MIAYLEGDWCFESNNDGCGAKVPRVVAVLFFWICGGEDVRHVYFMLGRI